MATTTTNFGWDIPQSTDLVKDGATAIAGLGQDIDTSMADLKGGTSGQILSKASNTDMDFAWVTPNPGDITGITAGTGLTGGGTSGDVTVSIDPTYYLLANQTRRNPVLNSAFNVWQRGTSFTTGSAVYTADRWYSGVASAGTVSRQATGDTTNLPNIQYALRYQRTAGQTSTSDLALSQSFETVNSIPFAGKQVTLSFYARAGANFSATSNALVGCIQTGTGTDQNLYTGYTGSATPLTTTATLTTTWQRFTVTGTIASTATEMGVQFYATPTGTAGAADYFEITGVQLELGSSANSYMSNQPTYQGELAACQRYYQIYGGNNTNEDICMLMAYSTTAFAGSFAFSQMRVAPTFTIAASTNFDVMNSTYGTVNCTAFGAANASSNRVQFSGSVASGLVAGNATELRAKTSASTIQLSAEL